MKLIRVRDSACLATKYKNTLIYDVAQLFVSYGIH